MDDMAGKISELLSNPEGLEKIKSMANALFGDDEQSKQNVQQEKSETASSLSLPEGFDPLKFMNIFSALKNNKTDDRATLLLALRPHLSVERQERVDKAVKLLKLASLLPLIKQQGILDELF